MPSSCYRNTGAVYSLGAYRLEQTRRAFDNVLHCEAEMLEHVGGWRGGAERGHPQDIAARTYPSVPAHRRARLDCQAAFHAGWQHRFPVDGILAFEQIEAGHTHNSDCVTPLLQDRLGADR